MNVCKQTNACNVTFWPAEGNQSIDGALISIQQISQGPHLSSFALIVSGGVGTLNKHYALIHCYFCLTQVKKIISQSMKF